MPVARPTLTAVADLAVGHWTDPAGATGCTVVLGPPDGVRAGIAVSELYLDRPSLAALFRELTGSYQQHPPPISATDALSESNKPRTLWAQ